jgi:hypothetical protein
LQLPSHPSLLLIGRLGIPAKGLLLGLAAKGGSF